MSNHTPGPWRRYVSGHNEDSWRIVSESKATGYIAFIPPQHEDAEANSRLIAAAPDLLTALTDLLNQLDGIGIPDWHGAEGLSLEQARAVIAKSEGSSS